MISGGKAIMQDDKGTREWQPKAGEFYDNPPIPWHETTNVGNTTMILPSHREEIRASGDQIGALQVAIIMPSAWTPNNR